MKRWEYMEVGLDKGHEIGEVLNRYGIVGWELVGIAQSKDWLYTYAILKREWKPQH